MNAYVINLDRAPERWAHMQDAFGGLPFRLVRVPAVEGNAMTLPIPEFDERKFRRFHGRGTNVYEIACYLSHIKAMRAFLDSGESHAIICEDDLYPKPGLSPVVEALMNISAHWNMVRLAGLKLGKPLRITDLGGGYSLTLPFHRFKGTGASIIDRKAAEALVRGLLPMWLPYDHALDREWVHGIRALSVAPFPISQTEEIFSSGIQGNARQRLPGSVRWRWTYPYQIRNELSRWFFRGLDAASLKLRFLLNTPAR
jgi:glycosyl transferase family 25